MVQELYQELQVLDRLEKDYDQKRREEENSASSSKGDGLAILKTELKSQRKVVKSLKKKSLWSRGHEEVLLLLCHLNCISQNKIQPKTSLDYCGVFILTAGLYYR